MRVLALTPTLLSNPIHEVAKKCKLAERWKRLLNWWIIKRECN